MSAALERFYSLDETIRAIKDDHASTLKSVNDALMAKSIELELTKDRLRQAIKDRDASERVTVKLVTQFAMVETVFAEAKRMALQVQSMEQFKEETANDPIPLLPKNQL